MTRTRPNERVDTQARVPDLSRPITVTVQQIGRFGPMKWRAHIAWGILGADIYSWTKQRATNRAMSEVHRREHPRPKEVVYTSENA